MNQQLMSFDTKGSKIEHEEGSLESYTQNYSSFGNLHQQSSFGEQMEKMKPRIIKQNRGSSNSTTRSQVSQKMANEASKKVLDIVRKPSAAESQSSLFDGSVRQNINFESYFGNEGVNTLNNTQGRQQLQEGELAPSQKYVINTVTRSSARITKGENDGLTSRTNNSITETAKSVSKSGLKQPTPAIGKTVAQYRPEASDTNSNTGKRSKASLSQRSRQSSKERKKQNSQRNRSGSQRSQRGTYDQQLKQLMKGNRQQPLVKAPLPLASATRSSKARTKHPNPDYSGFTESAEISNIDRYSSGGSESALSFDQNNRLTERALEIQLLEKARLELAQQAQMHSAKQEQVQRDVKQMLAAKSQNKKARAFINQAFDSFRDQFYQEQVTPGKDLEVSETEEDAENDMNYMNMPKQIHNFYPGKMEKLTSRSNLYELSSVSRSKSRSKSPKPRRKSEIQQQVQQSPTPYEDPKPEQPQKEPNSYKRAKKPTQNSNPIPLIHMQTPSSSSRERKEWPSSARQSRQAGASVGSRLAQSQRSDLIQTNRGSARASARQRLDSLKESARMYKTKAGGVQSGNRVLVDMATLQAKPNLPRSTNKISRRKEEKAATKQPAVRSQRPAWNSLKVDSQNRNAKTMTLSNRPGSRQSRQSSTGSHRNDGPRLNQSSRVFGSSLNYTRKEQAVNISEVENRLYERIDTNKKAKQNAELYNQLYTFQQPSARSSAQRLSLHGSQKQIQLNDQVPDQMKIEDGSDGDKDADFVRFLKSIQLYVQGQQPGESPRGGDGSYLYHNLQWLRERYKKFESEKLSTERQNQHLLEIQKYLAGGNYDPKTRNEILNQDLVLDSLDNVGSAKNEILKNAEFRSGEYPALFTSKGDQSWADQLSQTVVTQTQEHTLFSDRERPHSSNSRSRKSASPHIADANPIDLIPEKQRKQIEFIDQIYSQVVLKADERQEKKRTDRALKLQAQNRIRQIQSNYPKRSIEQSSVNTINTNTTRKLNQDIQVVCEQQKSFDSDINRGGQYSGYFKQPSQQLSSPEKQSASMTHQRQQDLMSVAESLKAAEDLKHICQELQDEKRRSLERRQNGLMTIQNNESVSFCPQSFEYPNKQLSQTLQSYDGKILSPKAVDSLRQTLSDEQNDLIAQVQMLQQRVGDPRNLSISQLGETLAALTTTANELRRACDGISEFTKILGNAQLKKEQEQVQKQSSQQQITFMEASSVHESRPNEQNASGRWHQQHDQGPYTMTATPTTQTDRQSYTNEPGLIAYTPAEQPSYVNSLADIQYPAAALARPVSHPSYINSVSEIQNEGPTMLGLQVIDNSTDNNSSSLLDHTYVNTAGSMVMMVPGARETQGNQVLHTQGSYLQTDPESHVQISQGTHRHQLIPVATAPLRNGSAHWAQQGKYQTAQRSANKNHKELLSQSIDSMDFTNSENARNQSPGQHQSHGTQDVKSLNSMNPATMIQQNHNPHISQSQSVLSSPRYQIPPTQTAVLSQQAPLSVNQQSLNQYRLPSQPSDRRRSSFTQSQSMSNRAGFDGPIQGINTDTTSRIQSIYGVPAQLQQLDSSQLTNSKEASYVHTTRKASLATHADKLHHEVKSPSSNYDYLHSNGESIMEVFKKDAQRAKVKENMARACAEYQNSIPQTYLERPRAEHSATTSPASNVNGAENAQLNEQTPRTLTPEEFAQLMAERNNTESFKLNSDSGHLLVQEASGNNLYRNYNMLNSPPEMPSGSLHQSSYQHLQLIDQQSNYHMINQPSTYRSSRRDPYHLQSESKSPTSPTMFNKQHPHYSTFTSQAGNAVRERLLNELMNQYQR